FFSPSLSGPYRSSPCRAAAASRHFCCFLFLNATSTTDIYTLSLHDALPIFILGSEANLSFLSVRIFHVLQRSNPPAYSDASALRSEEHTSELQSRENLVCRLLLEKKKEYNSHIDQ